jgi:hypothetical protein
MMNENQEGMETRGKWPTQKYRNINLFHFRQQNELLKKDRHVHKFMNEFLPAGESATL